MVTSLHDYTLDQVWKVIILDSYGTDEGSKLPASIAVNYGVIRLKDMWDLG